MTHLCKPEFKELPSFSAIGGAPMLRTFWDRLDFSLLFSQSGIFKMRGVATWILAFVYVVGLINRCQSVNSLASFFNRDGLLQGIDGNPKAFTIDFESFPDRVFEVGCVQSRPHSPSSERLGYGTYRRGRSCT